MVFKSTWKNVMIPFPLCPWFLFTFFFKSFKVYVFFLIGGGYCRDSSCKGEKVESLDVRDINQQELLI